MKRIAFLLSLFLLGSVMLVACGDEKAEVPKYAGATALTVPASVQTQFASAFKDEKFRNSKVEAFKSADAVAKIKGGYTDAFNKEGWKDILSETTKDASAAESIKQFESLGGFALTYSKGNKGAAVMAFPGIAGTPLGFQGVTEADTLILVISGNG